MSPRQRSFMQLVMRSPDVGDGYRKVSTLLTSLAEAQIALAPDLYETTTVDGGLRVRLTAAGEAVWQYR